MHIKILLTLTLLAAAKCSFSQDTTGGTRPTFVIPLHRMKTKTNVQPGTAAYVPGNPGTNNGQLTPRKKRKAKRVNKNSGDKK